MYLKGEWISSWLIVRGNFVAESIVFISYEELLKILGMLSGLNFQLIQYYAHLDSSNFPPEV